MSFTEPLDPKWWRGRPEEVLSPGGRWDVDAWGTGHAGVTLEGAGVVDGEEEDDVAEKVVGFCEEGEVLFLGNPYTLSKSKYMTHKQ